MLEILISLKVKWYGDEMLFLLSLRGHMVFVMGFMTPIRLSLSIFNFQRNEYGSSGMCFSFMLKFCNSSFMPEVMKTLKLSYNILVKII
jgi:hypothetical protein